MKKVLAIFVIAIAFLFTTNVAGASAATTAAPASFSSEVAKSAPLSHPGPVAFAAPQSGSVPQVFGGGVKPFANFTSCYWNIFGQYWCYRYGCTLYELVNYNCYNGWIKINRPIYT